MATTGTPQSPRTWRERATTTGWALLPLRLFLGVTMVYAGLDKFFSPTYLDPSSPQGVYRQMISVAKSSPISWVVTQAAEQATLVGLLIAFGELLVGLGILLGLWTRIAALGGFLIALSLFLTVSWGITPYYVGSDLIYMVAFTPLMIAGDGGVLSLWTTILAATRRRMRLAVPPPGDELAAVGAQVHRRSVLVGAVVAGGVAVGAALVGWAGRSVAGASGGGGGGGASPTPTPQPTGSPTPSPTQTLPPGAVRITATSTVPVGSAFSFTDPATGDPAYLLQPKQGTFMAYSGVCTHEGCIVNWNSGPSDFTCPCHGAVFSDTGEPLRGPVKEPLAPITVVEYAGDVYSV